MPFSYGGIGGWSDNFSFCCRLSCLDLVDHGFNMVVVIDKTAAEATDSGDGIHIDILEFVAVLGLAFVIPYGDPHRHAS